MKFSFQDWSPSSRTSFCKDFLKTEKFLFRKENEIEILFQMASTCPHALGTVAQYFPGFSLQKRQNFRLGKFWRLLFPPPFLFLLVVPHQFLLSSSPTLSFSEFEMIFAREPRKMNKQPARSNTTQEFTCLCSFFCCCCCFCFVFFPLCGNYPS